MRKYLTSFVLLVSIFILANISFAANTVEAISPEDSKASKHDWYNWYEMNFDTTGVLCIDTSTNHRINITAIKTGTISYALEAAIANNPESGESLVLPNDSALTGNHRETFIDLIPWFCVRVNTCTGCTLKATILIGR